MRAVVASACSRRRARRNGVGRQSWYASRTASGMAMSGSADTSCWISPMGKIGVKSSGPAGSPVRGLSGGGGGSPGRSAAMLTQVVGISTDMSRLYVLQRGVMKVTELGRNWGMDRAGDGVLGHMLLIPSLIFLAVI